MSALESDQNSNSRKKAKQWPYRRMAEYEQVLRAAAATWFKNKGLAVHGSIPYLLDAWDNWDGNMVTVEVADYIRQVRQNRQGERCFPLHKYIHHGLSSQAMLFNLVGPLMTKGNSGNALDPLRCVLERHGVEWPEHATADFEWDDRRIFNEDSGQPTSIDLWVHPPEAVSGGIFIEAKLVEREFGGCSVFANGDCNGFNPCNGDDFSRCYLHFIGRTYWSKLEHYGFLAGPMRTDTICLMANYYQFFREVLFALEKNGTFVLLVDERNPAFAVESGSLRGLWSGLQQLVPDALKSKLIRITVQEVVHSIESSNQHADWIHCFKQKYAIR